MEIDFNSYSVTDIFYIRKQMAAKQDCFAALSQKFEKIQLKSLLI